MLLCQADEPLVTARQIQTLRELVHGAVDMATLASIKTEADFRNPNCVKVVVDSKEELVLFKISDSIS